MISNRTRDLVDALVNEMMVTHVKEVEFGQALRAMDEQGRTEVAYLIEDTINNHPHKPTTKQVELERIERYIGYHVRRANWQVSYDDLLDELDDLNDYDHDILKDLDDGN